MRNRRVAVQAVIAWAALAGPAYAQNEQAKDATGGDPTAGRRIAAGICQACHGLNGLAKMPEMPTIAGSDASYMVRQLQAYRAGERNNESMSAVAPMLDDRKMADVAAYYAAIKVSAEPP